LSYRCRSDSPIQTVVPRRSGRSATNHPCHHPSPTANASPTGSERRDPPGHRAGAAHPVRAAALLWIGFTRLLRDAWPWQEGGLETTTPTPGFQTTQLVLTRRRASAGRSWSWSPTAGNGTSEAGPVRRTVRRRRGQLGAPPPPNGSLGCTRWPPSPTPGHNTGTMHQRPLRLPPAALRTDQPAAENRCRPNAPGTSTTVRTEGDPHLRTTPQRPGGPAHNHQQPSPDTSATPPTAAPRPRCPGRATTSTSPAPPSTTATSAEPTFLRRLVRFDQAQFTSGHVTFNQAESRRNGHLNQAESPAAGSAFTRRSSPGARVDFY